jgi:hypothetical protein
MGSAVELVGLLGLAGLPGLVGLLGRVGLVGLVGLHVPMSPDRSIAIINPLLNSNTLPLLHALARRCAKMCSGKNYMGRRSLSLSTAPMPSLRF